MHPDDLDDLFPMGDPRRCRSHPHVQTSSADGLHDSLCGQCEAEMENEAAAEAPWRWVGPALPSQGLDFTPRPDPFDDIPF